MSVQGRFIDSFQLPEVFYVNHLSERESSYKRRIIVQDMDVREALSKLASKAGASEEDYQKCLRVDFLKCLIIMSPAKVLS
jgi:hypothetical protein